jgi:hypothetical protein
MAFLFDNLLVWVGGKIKDMAEEELYGDKEKIQTELLGLQGRLDMGEISEEEYKVKEEQILDRLQIALEREKEE